MSSNSWTSLPVVISEAMDKEGLTLADLCLWIDRAKESNVSLDEPIQAVTTWRGRIRRIQATGKNGTVKP